MDIELTTDLVRELDAKGNAPLKIVHPITGKFYFLVSEEYLSFVRPLQESLSPSVEELRFQLLEAGRRADWDDPAMDAYDDYDQQSRQADS